MSHGSILEEVWSDHALIGAHYQNNLGCDILTKKKEQNGEMQILKYYFSLDVYSVIASTHRFMGLKHCLGRNFM